MCFDALLEAFRLLLFRRFEVLIIEAFDRLRSNVTEADSKQPARLFSNTHRRANYRNLLHVPRIFNESLFDDPCFSKRGVYKIAWQSK